MSLPAVTGSVLAQLQAGLLTATPAAREIGEWLLRRIDEQALDAAQMTTGSIAREVGCARATVVRFARSLGFKSFPEFQVALAVELAQNAPAPPGASALARAAQLTESWLEATLGRVDAAAFEQATALLARARRRVWFGSGDSGHLAASADHRCAVLGMPSQVVTAQHLSALLPSLGSEDCIVVISQSGRARPPGEPLSAYKVPVIGLTSMPGSRLAKVADCLLLTPRSDFLVGEAPLTLRAPQALVVDALLLSAATRRGLQIEGWIS